MLIANQPLTERDAKLRQDKARLESPKPSATAAAIDRGLRATVGRLAESHGKGAKLEARASDTLAKERDSSNRKAEPSKAVPSEEMEMDASELLEVDLEQGDSAVLDSSSAEEKKAQRRRCVVLRCLEVFACLR